ncbi:MAG: hypothetical protein O7B26_03040 [Planctomycetota bacterium]|nr:hypothetical protein [Planctomycetota bacterium]
MDYVTNRSVFHVRLFWPALVAVAAAIGLVAFGYSRSPAQRMSNLDLDVDGVPDTYIMFSKSEPGRCYVANRRSATMRRSDNRQPGRKWRYMRFDGSPDKPGPWNWLVYSKRKGTVFFVPVDEVEDWTYPFLYRNVRDQFGELNLPKAGWTQLFVNRIYEGLYLRVALPFDLRKKDGGSGILRELLAVSGERLSKVDTRFDDACQLYVECVARGHFPELSPPGPILAWLARRCPTRETTVLLSNAEPNGVSLLPLPVSIPNLYESMHGRPPASFEDARYLRWSQGSWRSPESGVGTPLEEVLSGVKAGFESYSSSFLGALRAHAEFHQSEKDLARLLSQRQEAIADLGLSLGAL